MSTYVFGDTEVKLTGRIAKKSIQAVRNGQPDKIMLLYEIESTNEIGDRWKKWVKMSDLYKIESEIK